MLTSPTAHIYSTRSVPKVKAQQLPLPLWPKSGHGFLTDTLDVLEGLPSVQAFLKSVQHSRRRCRPGYAPRTMWRAVCLKYLLNERFTVGLIERLKASPKLRQACGFQDAIPSEPTFSRFFKMVPPSMVETAIAQTVNKLRRRLPDIGEDVAVDSTDIEAHANPNRTVIRDPDAKWGHRTPKAKSATKKEYELFFGYKMHALNDATYGAPLAHIMLPANQNDSPQLPKLVQKAQRTYPWLKPKHLLADRGYDSQANHLYLFKLNIAPIIHIRKPTADDGLYDGYYNKDGIPVCGDGKTPMEYLGTHPDTGHHLFRCPPAGCQLKAKSTGAMLYCNSPPHWEDPQNNLRALGVVARASPRWAELYARRQIIERMFGSMKRMRLLDKHQYLTRRKIETHMNLSTLTYLATMLAHIRAGDAGRIRHMRIR